MRRLPQLNTAKGKIVEQTFDTWNYGENRLLSETTIRPNELSEAKNIVLVEQGLPKAPSWGYDQFGVDATGNKINLLGRYETSAGAIELLIVSGGKLRISDDDGATWTEISGVTFTTDQDVSGVQAYGKFWMVAEDTPLCFYDGTDVTTYVALSTPTWQGTPLVRTGLSSGDYTYYYWIVALSDVGTTLASTQQSITTSLDVVEWDDSNYVTAQWNAVTNATRYEIYRGDVAGIGELLDVVNSGTVETYDDYGGTDYVTNPLLGLPTQNTTAGPKGKKIELYKDSLVVVGDGSSRLYYSGPADHIGQFSRAVGGGWIDINRDADDGDITTSALLQDNLIVFKERSVWQFNFTADTSIGVTTRNITKAVGCVAPKSVEVVENDLFFLSDRGVFTLGNEAQYLNVIRTNELSARERPRVNLMDVSYMDNACAFYIDSKYWLFYTKSGDTTNNYALMYDRERLGWTYHTDKPFRNVLVFKETDDIRALAGGEGDADVYHFSDEYTDNNGSVINWQFATRAEDFKLNTIYKSPKDLHLKFSDSSGLISFQVENDGYDTIKDLVINGTVALSDAGMGVDAMGIDLLGVGEESSFETQATSVVRRSVDMGNDIMLNQKVVFSNVEDTVASMILRSVYMNVKVKSSNRRKVGEYIS